MKSVEKSAVGLWPSQSHHCVSLQPQRSAVIKAALETPHNCSTVIYMQLKFHVKQDKADGRRAEQRSSGRRKEGDEGREDRKGREENKDGKI